MTVAEYKRGWFDAKRAELHGRGMKDAHIAEQMGVKRAYFSQIVNGMNVSDQVIDRMCSAFAMKFISAEQVTDSQTPPVVDPALVEAIRDVANQGRRNNNVIDLLVEEVRSLREQVRALRGQPTP